MNPKTRFRFNAIVVATDLTGSTSSALRYAQAIAHLHDSVLVVVHVIDPVGYAFPDGAPAFVIADQVARDELRRIEKETRSKGIQIHSVVETGTIHECILQTVHDHHADLLVLGTSAKTEIGRFALGTVARQLLVRTPCPLLTVSPDADGHLSWAGPWRHVLVATDFSAASLMALNCAQEITHDKLTVLHVPRHCDERQCRRSLERMRFLAPFNESHTVPVEHAIVSGDAAAVISEHARKFDVDLVVLGAPLNELTIENFRSSTVSQVISHVSCPVLCVPSAKGISTQEIVEDASCTC